MNKAFLPQSLCGMSSTMTALLWATMSIGYFKESLRLTRRPEGSMKYMEGNIFLRFSCNHAKSEMGFLSIMWKIAIWYCNFFILEI